MTVQKDRHKPPQNRTQRIVMWSILGVATVLAIVAITILVTSGQRLF